MPDETRTIPYLDTSALAKWYLNEPLSEAVDTYLSSLPWAGISSLVVLEMQCLLARRRRNGEISAEQEIAVRGLLHDDISQGYLRVDPVADDRMEAAMLLLDRLTSHSLRTLDALHLAVVRSAGFAALATADRVMAEAAEELGITVQSFFPAKRGR